MGGPIKKDRLFFFLSFEGMRKREDQSVIRTVPSDDLRNGYLSYQCDILFYTKEALCVWSKL